MQNSKSLELAVRSRLQFLAKQHPQAEIARKTATSPANVNRYLRSNRIPVSFCAALVSGLGVNPAWLLAGEGTPYLADVGAGNEKLAGNLLELVATMNNVANMKLGSLAGKRGLSVLRELNDALLSFESLKGKLNEHSREIFRQVLKDWNAAIAEPNEERANSLKKAAAQVARLCEDDELDLRNLQTLARHEFDFGDLRRVPDIQRKVFFRSLGQSGGMDERAFNEARMLVSALDSVGKAAEAERLCRALLALAEEHAQQWKGYAGLLAQHGGELMALRDIRSALARFHEAAARGARSPVGLLQTQIAYFLVGTLDFAAFRDAGPRDENRADWCTRFAIWLEDVVALEAAAGDYEKARAGVASTSRIEPAYCRLLARAIARKDKRALSAAQEMIAKAPFLEPGRPPWNVTLPDWLCQLARYCGRREEALTHFREADRALSDFSRELQMPMHLEATHWRNALELGERVEAAREFFKAHLARGYGFLESYARGKGILNT